MYILTNGHIVSAERIYIGYDLVVKGEFIIDICVNATLQYGEGVRVIDVNEAYIMPGFIDIHSDYIEHIAAPRPQSLMDFEMALYEAERELLTHGITTMYHSLSLLGNQAVRRQEIRNTENVLKLVELINNSHGKRRLIHHKMHLRYEIDNLDQYDLVLRLLAEGKVQLLSFMDHSPGQGQYRDLEVYSDMMRSYDHDNSAVLEAIEMQSQKQKITFEQLQHLSQVAKQKNVPLASHDDDTTDKIEVISELGATISEFPITFEAAEFAKKKQLHTVGGAPNILLGKSHSGNLSMIEGIKASVIDILCSDYYPASLLHSIFKLTDLEIVSLPEAVRMVTLSPAKALGIERMTGSLAIGKTADIIVVEKIENNIPVVTKTFVKGELVNETTYRR